VLGTMEGVTLAKRCWEVQRHGKFVPIRMGLAKRLLMECKFEEKKDFVLKERNRSGA
jgi:hypothetical protein